MKKVVKKAKKDNMLLIYVLGGAILFMAGAYAIFTQSITLTGTATADADFAIIWENASITDSKCSATEAPTITVAGTVLTMNPELQGPTCFVTVSADVTNTGNIPAKITGIVPTSPIGTDMVVTYNPNFALNQTIGAGLSTPVEVTVTYNATSTNQAAISEVFGVVVTYTQDL